MIEDFCKNGDDMNNMLMLDMYAQNIAEMVNWLMNDVGVTFQDGLIFQAEYQKDRVLYPVGAAKGLTQCLIDSMEAGDAEYMLDTRATELITQDGKVCGVKAQGIDKDYVIYADAVLMASGGYGYAKDLLPESLQSVLYYGPTFATGDGQKMVMAVDAKFDLFDLGKIYPNGVEVAAGTAKSTIWPNAAAFSASGILVNLDGQRIVNEKASNNDLKQVLMEQPGQIMYLFMDAESFDAFCSRAGENGISDEEIAAWLENNGSCAPIFAHGETIDEVCAIVGMNAEGLAATVARYNGFVEAGNDEDFGRPAAFLAKGIGEGPYYIVEQKPRFATTMGGVVLTGNMEVVNSQDQVIPGLYACGEMANLVHGSNSPVGANVSWALTSGYLAGEAVAKALNK
ncbi:MAG: FAD-binding protein, partial [Clostridiales bacterium]|nr:FAD-binding protein [Clostridiales bacterium]